LRGSTGFADNAAMSDAFRQMQLTAPPPPRELTPELTADAARNGRFLRLFGAIWLAVGGGLTTLFGILGVTVLHALSLGCLLSGAFAVAGGVIFGLGKRAQARALSTYRDGIETEGEVNEVYLQQNVRINGRSPWRVNYTFMADDQPVRGAATFWAEPDVDRGARVVVLYKRDDPGASVLWTHFETVARHQRPQIAVAKPSGVEAGPG
jgi:hypothetical protein